MHDFTKMIIQKYEIRKSDKQKKAFIDEIVQYCEQLGYTYQIQETKGLLKSRNLIVGDVKKAKVYCTAHYDTCATMGFLPNFITPLNQLVYYSYQFALSFGMIALAMILGRVLENVTGGIISYFLGYTVFLFGIFYQLMMGYRNPKNYNDNTSGMVTLLELMAKVDVEDRDKICFIFFDNEEKGLLGSGAFRKRYASKVVDKLLVNFDCVGDGDTLFMKYNRSMSQSKNKTTFETAFVTDFGKEMLFSDKGVYPSDQKHFDKICDTVAVAALKKSKVVGLYMDRIHTPKDTILDEKNVEILVMGMINYIKEI